ncbi:CPBP family intramembrane glutamic endopeptidase [Cytobacillus purgationiresistens]|nr:CPBP family intramembrane glutamic endopeptidase [Cytobacillus purgationiresistens]
MTLIYMFYIAITEEFIFRGFLITALNKSFGMHVSIIIAVFVFVFIGHLPKINHLFHHPPYIFHLFAFGLVLSYAYVLSESLWLSVGLHWGWNLGSFLEERMLL